MPLVAMDGETRVAAPLVDEERWASLRASSVALPCGARAVPKENRYGTRFFAHWPGSHCDVGHKPESPEHLRAKEIIVRAAIAAGWDAEPEMPGPDRAWVADVLASRGEHRVALEVQWSHQTPADYVARTARYRADGIDAYWFSRHQATWKEWDLHVPVFSLTAVDGVFTASPKLEVPHAVGERELGAMVTALLRAYPRRWRPHSDGAPGVAIEWVWQKCWSCAGWSQIWHVADQKAIRCQDCHHTSVLNDRWSGFSFLDPYEYDTDRIFPAEMPAEGSPDVQAAVTSLQKRAAFTFRRTKQAATTHYGFACPSCRAPFGNMYVREERSRSWTEEQMIIAPAPAESPAAFGTGGHWCNPPTG
ncbi:competence protein CoiA [Agromyces sp. NPDC057679]|uniref:competence protein CoiA n=1 Tax=Agromyces sp. NPDC057679 TaxID=3346207 RepID=UPI003672017A